MSLYSEDFFLTKSLVVTFKVKVIVGSTLGTIHSVYKTGLVLAETGLFFSI